MKPDNQHRPAPYLPDLTLGRRTLIQRSTLAGFRHHRAAKLWQALRKGELLTLERDADNPHDQDAVSIRWKGEKLGYLPRGENFVVARLLDGARTLSACIERLNQNAPPNRRVSLKVYIH